MKTTSTAARKWIAAIVAIAMEITPLGPGAYGALTVLADSPIAAKVAAKPNLLYTLDDSGSMNLSYIPDWVINGPGQSAPNNTGPGYCRATAGNTTTGCGTAYTWGYHVPMFSADFNRLYYNPNITYDPPVDGAGNQASMAAPNGAPGVTAYKMMTAANSTNWTAVKNNPYLAATTANIAANVGVRVYCNTDWPRDNPVNILSVGNALGEYSPTAGADCRINGTSYDLIDSAPAIQDDYNYPYNRSSGTVNDPKYFYRNSFNRSIWCKTGAAGWPKTTTGCPYTCTMGGTLTYPTNQVQTCVAGGTTTGAPWTYSPAGCDTDPLYQWTWAAGGCVGTIGVECLACNRTGIITARAGSCSITGVACGTAGSPAPPIVVNGNPACPNATGTTPTGCTVGSLQPPTACNPASSAACNSTYGGTGGTGGSTLLMDANGAGVTCRHNNMLAGSYTSNRFTYPESTAVDPTKYNKQVSDANCGTVAATVNIPQHYYTAASVQFCNAGDATVNGQWRGYGTGTCQANNDLNTYINVKFGKFTRVDLVNDGRTYTYTDPFTGTVGARTYAEEMTNYANWYAYYRTRVLTAKTTSAIAFNIVDNAYRAGFHVLNQQPMTWFLDSGDFDAAQRSAWYGKLFSVNPTTGKTPTLDGLIRIGQLVEFGAGAVAGLPAHTDPIPTVAGKPVSCTNNYHILFTDGYTDQITLPTVVGEVDGASIPAHAGMNATELPDGDPTHPERTVASLTGGSPWPRPFKDVATATPNTLADIALYYWMRDLRPNNVLYPNNVPAHDGRAGADLDWQKNPAYWQHVSFSALMYGSQGLLDTSNVTGITNQLAAGTKNWFTAPNYPAPPNNAPFPAFNKRAVTADDLWHATVNARGKFVYAETPIEIAYGLGSIISGIMNNPKARVGASFASRNLSATNNFIYEATIEPGWSGELKKVTIDTTTGVQGATRWSAGVKLNTLLQTPAAGTSPLLDINNTWFLNRNIVTRNVDAGTFTVVPFRYANLNAGPATQLNTLSANATQQQKIVSYLRGGSTFGAGPNPQLIEGVGIGQFRLRSGKLGNISDSKPVIVGEPNKPFTDADDYGYTSYKTANAGRALRVYVGANDGLFHVFNGLDDTAPNTGGTETWAYIPSGVFTTAFDEGGKARKGIQALTFQDGGAPIFKHHFYVNSPPRTQDVDFANCGSNSACSPNWKTIVVAGLGKGGNTYFAIDATDPAVANEAQASARVLWEFPLPNSQFSFGKPLIVKTRAYGWVVVVASGYNNSDGKGHIYFLRASDGTLLRTLNTTGADSGSPANPSGLAQISGYVKDDANQIIEQIYGGDLNGRLWRWDVSDIDPTTWQAKTVLFANLTDPTSGPQPVTTAPEIEIDLNNGIDRYVFIGTGRLLDPSDLTTPSPEQIQTAYAIRDGTLDTALTTGLPIAPRGTLAPIVNGITGVATTAPNGWYEDLPLGQRVVVDVVAEFNVFAYVGTELQPDPCLTSLPAKIYARDYVSGESLIFTGGVQQPFFSSTEGAVGLELVALEDPSKSFPVISLVFTKETNASIQPITIRPRVFGGGHRMSWRLLGE